MWLPKDERYLLQGYWHYINEINVEKTFSEFDLVPLLSSPKNWKKIKEDSGDEKIPHEEMRDYFNKQRRVSKANECLAERKLIKLSSHSCYCALSLTMDGFDLARKYSSWWERSGLWFASLKDHWIWLLCSFIGGILGALIIEVIKKCLN